MIRSHKVSDSRINVSQSLAARLLNLEPTPSILSTPSTINIMIRLNVKSTRSTTIANPHWIWAVHRQNQSLVTILSEAFSAKTTGKAQ